LDLLSWVRWLLAPGVPGVPLWWSFFSSLPARSLGAIERLFAKKESRKQVFQSQKSSPGPNGSAEHESKIKKRPMKTNKSTFQNASYGGFAVFLFDKLQVNTDSAGGYLIPVDDWSSGGEWCTV